MLAAKPEVRSFSWVRPEGVAGIAAMMLVLPFVSGTAAASCYDTTVRGKCIDLIRPGMDEGAFYSCERKRTAAFNECMRTTYGDRSSQSASSSAQLKSAQKKTRSSGPPPGATAVHETSGNSIPNANRSGPKPTMCVDPKRGSIPMDCSAPGAQPYTPPTPVATSAPTPTTGASPITQPLEPLQSDIPQQPSVAPQQAAASLRAAEADSCVTNIDTGTNMPCKIIAQRQDVLNTRYSDGTPAILWTLTLVNACQRRSLSATIYRDGDPGNEGDDEITLAPGQKKTYECNSAFKCTKMTYKEHCGR
jgi:hypothetical protein